MTAASTRANSRGGAATRPNARPRKRWLLGDESTAIAFLLPNLLGVLTFVIFPVFFSLTMAFTNWDLKQHNPFSDEAVRFVGLRNFIDLLTEGQFLRFLGNTLFFMMGIPLSVGGSLVAAMLLSGDGRPPRTKTAAGLAAILMMAGIAMMFAAGLGLTGLTVLILGVFGLLLGGGMLLGPTLYRTVFYTPFFVAGVATFILWKKLYNPQTGPVNAALEPLLATLAGLVNASPSALVAGLPVIPGSIFALLMIWGLSRLHVTWIDGDLGGRAALLPVLLLHVPVWVAASWSQTAGFAWAWIAAAGLAWAAVGIRQARKPNCFSSPPGEGFGTGFVVALVVMVGMFAMLGLTAVLKALPALADDGLEPARWLTNIHWAKPSLMIMGFWAAIGSNNMLLYLAALSGVPGELYEAADIDGAKGLQRFWNVTWPQLAPTTFFILVMSTIGGLQGGFEMAKVMTGGGPAGATTTLSYFIYIEGFETGRLGFASAVAWVLFALVFGITLFNWKFGNRYVNE